MLVHSFLYYQMDTSIVADTTYDKWSKELANLMKNNKEIKSYPDDPSKKQRVSIVKDI